MRKPLAPARAVFVAADPRQGEGTVLDTGHCARHVQIVAGIGHSSTWRRGERVRTIGEIEPGTVIATFGPDGRYANRIDGASHAAIYLAHEPGGIRVMDQWTGHPVSERVIRYDDSRTAANDGGRYYVVETV